MTASIETVVKPAFMYDCFIAMLLLNLDQERNIQLRATPRCPMKTLTGMGN